MRAEKPAAMAETHGEAAPHEHGQAAEPAYSSDAA
jgi:hypothetical protein